MASSNMDESILSFDQEGFLQSSVLVPMGIKINKPHMEVKIKDVIRRFNEVYLETMDFLTQILPLAREQFGRSDNLLLPKTPSKTRHRKIVQDLCNQENNDPNIVAQMPEDKPPQVKRTTRSSKRNDVSQVCEEPMKTRTTRSRAKKVEPKSEQSKVTFVENSKIKQVAGTIELLSEKKKSIPSGKTLKRTSSTSPLSTKPIKKKSKSSDESCVIEDNLSDKQTSTPVGTKAPEALSLSLITAEPELMSKPSVSDELVNNAEKDKTVLLDLETSEKGNGEEMDIEISKANEPEKLVDIGDYNETIKRPAVVSVCNTPPPSPAVLTNVEIKPETSILVNINDTPDKITKITESSVICKTPVPEIALAVVNKTPPGGVAIEAPANEIINDAPCNEIAYETLTREIVDENPANEIVNGSRADEAVNNVTMTCTDEVVNDAKDEQLSTATESTPVEVQLPRRSERLSKQVVAIVTASKGLPKQELPAQMDEQKPDEEERSSDSQDELSSKQRVSITPEPKPLRRSTRVSRRISKVSTGYVRRSSRLSTRRSSCFKRPQPLKQVEVNLIDVGLDRATKSPLVGGKSISSAGGADSSTESEDEHSKTSGSTVGSTITTPRQRTKTDSSSSDDVTEAPDGKVAGLVKRLNGKNQDEQSSMCKTPTGLRNLKIKRLGSAVQESSQRPSNLIGGSVKSFIKRQSVKKYDPSEVIRQRKLELQRKEEKDKERKDQAELRRKNWVEEQKRKREEKQKRVAEAKAAREREEQDKKQRQLEERRQVLHASEQARKKREHEEETKRKLREQRTKEAEARRLKEKEERLKRQQEKEEEDKMYREMLKRKLEGEEQERKQRIQEEKRVHELKQRERVREKEEERERRLKEIKEREAKRIEKEEAERKHKEETERREKEEKERKQREQEDREKKRIAQLIRDKMEQEKKSREQKLQKEEKERREREEQRKREAQRAAMLQATKTADSYLMTPPPAQTRKPATSENYDISDIRSDESTDDEDAPRKKVPYWAQGAALKYAILQQEEPRRIFEELASGFVPHAPDLEKIFTKKRKRFYQRTSSAHWNSPPIKV